MTRLSRLLRWQATVALPARLARLGGAILGSAGLGLAMLASVAPSAFATAPGPMIGSPNTVTADPPVPR